MMETMKFRLGSVHQLFPFSNDEFHQGEDESGFVGTSFKLKPNIYESQDL